MKKCYLMVGTPGAGKSTYIKNHIDYFPGRTAVVSRDKIRFSLVAECEEYFSREKEVYKEFIRQIIVSLKDNDNVIIDATHLNEASRRKIINSLGPCILDDVELDCIFMDVPVGTCLINNQNRAGTRAFVPEEVIRRMSNQLTMPKLEEGFDKIYIYNPTLGVKYKVITREGDN